MKNERLDYREKREWLPAELRPQGKWKAQGPVQSLDSKPQGLVVSGSHFYNYFDIWRLYFTLAI